MMKKNAEITVVLDSLRSAYNTGNIFRIADAIGAKEIITCGYTPFPPHAKLEKTALGAEKSVRHRHFDRTEDALTALRGENLAEIVAVESGTAGSKCLWSHDFKFPLALVFGNEARGISENVLELCDATVFLPVKGRKTSINVGNCAAAVLYFVLSRMDR